MTGLIEQKKIYLDFSFVFGKRFTIEFIHLCTLARTAPTVLVDKKILR